jgi:hypothetical protein
VSYYLGPPGALVTLPDPETVTHPRVKKGGQHELLGGGTVRDTIGWRRRFTLSWDLLTLDELSVLEALYEQAGPFEFLDQSRRNQLTANQANGTDSPTTVATDGFIARFGGAVSSTGTQFRSGKKSALWTVTPSSTGWGLYLQNSTSVVDASWCVVRPSAIYTLSGYMRASLAISMKAGVDWYDAAGGFISADTAGSGQALNTGNWNIRVTRTTPASPSNAAYGIGWFTNTTTSLANSVFLDDVQFEQGAAATTWTQGTGTPTVFIDSLDSSTPWDGRVAAEMVLVEV